MAKKSEPSDSFLPLRKAFFAALDESRYSARKISGWSDIPPASISLLKNGKKDVGLTNFQRLVNALPEDAAIRFYKILGKDLQSPVDAVVNTLPELSDEDLAVVVAAIAELSIERNCDGQAHFSMALKFISYMQLELMPELLNKIGAHIKHLGSQLRKI